jgi:hypothetical protein
MHQNRFTASQPTSFVVVVVIVVEARFRLEHVVELDGRAGGMAGASRWLRHGLGVEVT